MSEPGDQDPGRDSVEVQWGNKSIRLRRYDTVFGLITFIGIAVVGALAWGFWTHLNDTRDLRREEIASRVESAKEMALAIREFSASQREVAYSVRLQTCVGLVTPDLKLEQLVRENSYCQRAVK